MTFDDWEDEWETDLTTFGSTVESSLVQSRLLPLVFPAFFASPHLVAILGFNITWLHHRFGILHDGVCSHA